MADEHLQTDDDIEAILGLAVRKGVSSSEELRTRLLSTGAELGLTPAQIEAAEEEYRVKRSQVRAEVEAKEAEEKLWAEFRRAQRGDLITHVGTYLAVNTGLMAMDWFQGGGITWAFWPILGWGIAVMIHVVSYVAGFSGDSQNEFDRWKDRRGYK